MIESILSNKKNDKEFRAWAKAISSAEYAVSMLCCIWNLRLKVQQILSTSEAEEYWIEVQLERERREAAAEQ